MSEAEAAQHLEVLERQATEVTARIQALQDRIQKLKSSNPNARIDQFTSRLTHLWAVVVELFPDAISQFDGSVVLPCLAGMGEVGPGNIQYPDYSPTTGDPLELPANRRTR